MKIFVVYDKGGRITSGAVVSGELAEQMELLGTEEESVMEASLSDVGLERELEVDDEGLVSEESMGTLRETFGRMRVEVGRRRLVREK